MTKKETLKECIDKGIILLPATGRPTCAIPKEIMDIPGIRFYMSSNGAIVFDRQENKPIRRAYIEKENAILVLGCSEDVDVWREVCIDGESFAASEQFTCIEKYTESDIAFEYLKSTRKPTDDMVRLLMESSNQIERVSFFSPKPEYLNAIKKRVELIPDISVTFAMPKDLEIGHKSATKGDALKFMMDYLGIEKEEVMSFGDGHNDISMIQAAGIGVAMSNAEKDLQDVADYITCSNEEDGVAKAIRKFVL